MQKNFIIFIVLTFIFSIIYFTVLSPKLFPPKPVETKVSEIQQQEEPETVQEKSPEENVQQNQPPASPDKSKDLFLSHFENKEVILENDFVNSTFSSIGGKITSFYLKKYMIASKDESEMVISSDNSLAIFPLETALIDMKTLEKTNPIDFEIIENTKDKLVLRQIILDGNKNPVEIIKSYHFNNSYEIDLSIEINGLDNKIPTFSPDQTPLLLGWGYLLGPKDILSSRYNNQEVTYYSGDKYTKLKLKDNKTEEITNYKWFSVNNLYFTYIVKKDDAMKYSTYATQFNKKENEVLVIPQKFELIKNSYAFKIYYLPKKRGILGNVDKSFKNIASYAGILNFLVIAFNGLLEFIYKVVRNYGIAILILSFLIKMLLYPLTHKSMVSMRKMSDLSPRIQEIQNRYKSDPAKAQQEISALYKAEGVSPISGCLPMLLQFPFLIALYNAILYNLDLRNSAFLWIHDLSSPDVLFTFSFKLPFIGNEFRLLPLLMIIVSIIQTIMQSKGQTYTNPEQKTQSQIMGYAMPILFFFLFYNFSSGLVLYWTAMNIFTLIETYFTNKKMIKK